jgi:hypothetical protein
VAKDGQPRIENPRDLVRLEVETALKCPAVRVIPVLVDGAEMPEANGLPEPLRPLPGLNALVLHDPAWDYHMGRLIEALEQELRTGLRPGRLGGLGPAGRRAR